MICMTCLSLFSAVLKFSFVIISGMKTIKNIKTVSIEHALIVSRRSDADERDNARYRDRLPFPHIATFASITDIQCG